jgi:hypothetical protein
MECRKIGYEEADRMELSQDKEKWLTLVNMVTNLHIPYKEGIVSYNDYAIFSSSDYIW